MFVHRRTWVLCPFNAIACHAALADAHGEGVFENVPSNASQYTNHLLRRIISLVNEPKDPWQRRINVASAKDMRSAPAQHLSDEAVPLPDIAHRGNWNMKGIQTIFHYICGSRATDKRAALALSEWSSDSNCAFLPIPDDWPEGDKEPLTKLAIALFSPKQFEERIKCILLCVLLKDLPKMETDTSSQNLIVKKVKSLAPLAGVTPCMLKKTCILMKDLFTRRNGTLLSYTSMEDDSLVNIGPIKECLFGITSSVNKLTMAFNDTAGDNRVLFERIIEKQDRLARSVASLEERFELIERSLNLPLQHYQGSPDGQGSPGTAAHYQGSPDVHGSPGTPGHGHGQGGPEEPGETPDSIFETAFPRLKKLEWNGIISTWHRYGLSKLSQFPTSDNFKALSRMYVYSLHFLPSDDTPIQACPSDIKGMNAHLKRLQEIGKHSKECIKAFLLHNGNPKVEWSSAWSIKRALDQICVDAYKLKQVSNIDTFTNFQLLGFDSISAFRRRNKNKRKANDSETISEQTVERIDHVVSNDNTPALIPESSKQRKTDGIR